VVLVGVEWGVFLCCRSLGFGRGIVFMEWKLE